MPFLKARDITSDEWKCLLEGLSIPQARMIIESPEAIIFDWFDKSKVLNQFFRGRIFSPSGEFKWRKIGGLYRTVSLGDNDWVGNALDDFCHELSSLERRLSGYILWGERHDLEPEWIEQIIPQRLCYPLSNGKIARGRVKLIIEEWVSKTGEVVFNRLYDLKETEGGL